MTSRRLVPIILAGALVVLSVPASARPDFLPSPRQMFDGFVAINAPRPEVPVGALWIAGYGPVGEGASPDNLEAARSLNGVTIDKGLNFTLSVGLLELLGIDPRLRDRFTARLTDLSIVRVKDVSKLAGPKGEPRIVEAIKAATIIVSSDSEFGINGQMPGWLQRSIKGDGTSGRNRAYAIEGRDVFIAIRVATPELVRGKERDIDLRASSANELRGRIDDYEVLVRAAECKPVADTSCPAPRFAVRKLNSHGEAAPPEFTDADAGGEALLRLPVPIADEKGGLFDSLAFRWALRAGPPPPGRAGDNPFYAFSTAEHGWKI